MFFIRKMISQPKISASFQEELKCVLALTSVGINNVVKCEFGRTLVNIWEDDSLLRSNFVNLLINAELYSVQIPVLFTWERCWITAAGQFYKLQTDIREKLQTGMEVCQQGATLGLVKLGKEFKVRAVLLLWFIWPVKLNSGRTLACVGCLWAGECRTWTFFTHQILKLTRKIPLENRRL